MDREKLHRFFAGTASFEEEEEICNWSEASEKNLGELVKERKYFDIQLFHQAKERKRPTAPVYRISPAVKDWLKVAAAVAILIVSALQVYTYVKPKDVIAFNKIVVPPGQRVNLTLSDGTNVWLNARTELTYPAFFKDDLRQVTLNGEGYFEVTEDSKRPFIVQTKSCDVKVLGTKFNVEAYDNSEIFSAALMEGSIRLTDRMRPGTTVLLSPLQKADFRNGKFTVASITDYDTYRWKEGLICFESILFADLMKEFEKTYDIRIQISNKKLADYKCSGKFRIADGIDFVLRVLQRNARFDFERNEDNTIIYIK